MSTSSSSPSTVGLDTTNSSSPTTSTTSSVLSTYKDSESPPPWIIYHLIEKTIPCELPLRIMFSFNAGMLDENRPASPLRDRSLTLCTGQKCPTLKNVHNYWNYEGQGKLITEFFSSLDKITPTSGDITIAKLGNPPEGPPEPKANPDNAAADRFMDLGNDELLAAEFASFGLPDKTRKGLPVVVILNTVKRILQQDYKKVDFGHALTALDYLRDLELTRRAKLRNAAERLNITLQTWRAVLADNPDALRWIELVQKYELIIEEGYANIFIDIRIWVSHHRSLEQNSKADFAKTIVAELKSEPFYKPNVLAMLNTLFPPTVGELPNDRIQPKVMNQYRSSFYRYITAVETNGSSVMKAFENKLQRDDNRHSWRSTWDNLQHYISLAELMIKQAEVAIDLGIDMFVSGNYTYSSPLGHLERHPSRFGDNASDRSPIATEANFDSSFEGPSTRPKTLKRGFSFGSLSFRSHSRSRANTNNTTGSRPSILPNNSFDTSGLTLVDRSSLRSHANSFDTTQSTAVSNTIASARQSIYANAGANASSSTIRATPPLPKLDTGSIRSRHRTVSKLVMPFNSPDSPAAQSEAFSSTIILKDYKKSMNVKKGRVDLIDHPAAQIRPSTSHGEKASKGGLFSKDQKRPSTANGEKNKKGGEKGKVEQPVKKKKVKIGVRKDTSATGEDPPESGLLVKAITAERPHGVEIPDKVDGVDPILEDMKEAKARSELKRPSTSHGEKAWEGSQTPTLKPRSSTFPEAGKPQTSKDKNSRPELQRPSTSHGEKASQQLDSPEVRDITLENRRSTLRKPVPLGELKVQRTVSFYNAHMDSPSMPPPLSLGPKKPVQSSLGPNTRASSSIPRPTSSRGPKSPLPSDGGAFLNKPYIEPPVIKKSLRKRPSFSSLFLRKTESTPKEEVAQVVPEPDALEISKPSKLLRPILKASKSTPALPQVKIEETEPKATPVLKTQRSFGESLRAKFNMKSAEKPVENPTEKPAEAECSPVLPKKEEPAENLSYAEKIQRGELPYPPIEGWKPSYLLKDPSLPRTPRGLDSPHFDEFPKYETGTVALPVWLPQTRKQRDKFEDLEGKYNQGEELDQGEKLRGRRWEAEVRGLKESVGVMVEGEEERREKRYKEKFRGLMGQQARTAEEVEKEGGAWGAEVEKVPVRSLVFYNTDERIGPLLREVKAIVDGEPTVVAEGTGEEDQPSPSDKASFLKIEKGARKSLRPTKSMGDLRPSTQPDKNNRKSKLVKKEKKEVKSSTGITPSMISSPRLVSLPEWEEEIESSLSKEYTRKFLMEKARAEKRRVGDLDLPKGPPINKDVAKKNIRVAKKIATLESVKEGGLSPSLKPDFVATLLGDSTIRGTPSVVAEGEKPKQKRVRILSQATNSYGREFEEPRATPKPPRVPERKREDSIFAQRE